MDISVRREAFAQADYSWLGSAHGTDAAQTITLDVSAFTENTHYPNGYIPSGTAVGKITASGLYGPYDDGASDGTEVLDRFVLEPVKVDGTADVAVASLVHGIVVPINLPFAIDANGAADIAGRFTLIGGLS